jgi:hypothetical protein
MAEDNFLPPVPDKLKFGITCCMCGSGYSIVVDGEGYAKWKGGELIQNALPELTPAMRELLISKVCGPCYDEMFDIEDDSDEDE